jgi:hypothetical protein
MVETVGPHQIAAQAGDLAEAVETAGDAVLVAQLFEADFGLQVEALGGLQLSGVTGQVGEADQIVGHAVVVSARVIEVA